VEQLWLVAEAIKLAFSGSGEGQSMESYKTPWSELARLSTISPMNKGQPDSTVSSIIRDDSCLPRHSQAATAAAYGQRCLMCGQMSAATCGFPG